MTRDEAMNKGFSAQMATAPGVDDLVNLAKATGIRRGSVREITLLQQLLGLCWDRMTPEAKMDIYLGEEVAEARRSL